MGGRLRHRPPRGVPSCPRRAPVPVRTLPPLTDAARRAFRVLTRTRSGYAGASLHDVQLQVVATGELAWAQTFSDAAEAAAYRASIEADLAELDVVAFGRKHGVQQPTG